MRTVSPDRRRSTAGPPVWPDATVSAVELPARPAASRALTWMLTSSPVMTLKGIAKRALWTVRGWRRPPPAMPESVSSVLFVCLGNICRSPFAALRLEQRLLGQGRRGVRVASAGISARQAARPPEFAIAAAREHFDISMDQHQPVLVTRDLLSAFDVVVVMEPGQRRALVASYPELAGRIVLLPEFDPAPASSYARFHVDDPFGRPRAAFDACYARIDRCLDGFVARLPGIASLTSDA